MERALRLVAILTGVTCLALGLAHVVFGPGIAPGAGEMSATAHSQDRFYGAIFAGYGIAWLWAGRQHPAPLRLLRFLALIMLLGGVGRVIAMVVSGRPHELFVALTVVEFVLPALVFWLTARRWVAPA